MCVITRAKGEIAERGVMEMAKKSTTEHRKIPLKEDFMMTKTVSARIYGYLQCKSYLTEDKRRYVLMTDCTPTTIQRGMLEKNGDMNPQSISLGTIKSGISLFKKSELIVQGEVMIKGSKKKCYYLPEERSHFQLIELDTLRYLVNTSNSEVIKVYAYLLNKSQNFVNYSFTGKELAIAIGYDYKQKNTKNKIKDIILFLENNGLLVKSNYYEKVGQNGSLPVPRMRIVEVNTKVKGA